MKRSGMPADGSRQLAGGEWRGQHPMRTIWEGYAERRRQKGKVADSGGTEWAATSTQCAWGRRKGRRDAPDMIRKEHPDGQGAEDAWGGGGSSGCGRYASGVKVVFADASSTEEEILSI